MAFGFGAVEEMTGVRDQLRSRFGRPLPIRALTPLGQLVKSSISGRTRDEVSWNAYRRLCETYPEWSDLAHAPPGDVEAVISEVTFADVKALHLHEALNLIAASRPDFDLSFLGRLSVARALAWLERLPGVGRKVAASTLNFSTLRMPAFVIDTHVLRILRRFGFAPSTADSRAAYDTAMAALDDWSAADLVEFHILMKRLGQHICRDPHAYCQHCPINQRCQTAAAHLRHSADVGVGCDLPNARTPLG